MFIRFNPPVIPTMAAASGATQMVDQPLKAKTIIRPIAKKIPNIAILTNPPEKILPPKKQQ
jgi:hypothetical protein